MILIGLHTYSGIESNFLFQLLLICMFVADHLGWWTKRESQQKSGMHLQVILEESNGKATQLELAQTANIRSTTVM